MKWYYIPVVTAASLAASMAYAADVANKKAPAAPPPPPAWLSTLTIDGFVEGGVAVNFNQPFNGINWGHLYTDRSNWPTFNGAVLTVQRPIDPKADTYDFGFKFQPQLGEDARYNHLTGFLDYAIPSRTQVAVLEANVQAHLPWKSFVSQGGIDVKAGIFPTYNGFELMNAKDNLFYSHSYIFNFGPFLHTGVMVTTHVRDWLDVYTGVTTGVNNWIGYPGQPNASPSFHGGLGVTLLDGNLTILGIVHHGPQNPSQGRFNITYTPPGGVGFFWPNNAIGGIPGNFACVCNANTADRTFTNLTTTWKVTDNLTLITDMAYNRETGWNPISFTGFPQNWYGGADAAFLAANAGWPGLANLPQKTQGAESWAVAQYASYKINDLFKVNGRIEYYRDNKNFFVTANPGYYDSVNAFHGYPNQVLAKPANVGTSYLALTAGVTITPELPKMPIITGLIIRPEFRWDTALNNATPFYRGVQGQWNPVWPTGNWVGLSKSQGMFNMDVIVPFSLL